MPRIFLKDLLRYSLYSKIKLSHRNGSGASLVSLLTTLIISCSPELPSQSSSDMPTANLSEAVSQPNENLITAESGEWAAYGADLGNTKYAPLEEINAANINEVEIAWRRPALDPRYLQLNPNQRFSSNYVAAAVVRGGIGYIPNAVGLVEAFDPGTGETVWVQEAP